MRNFMLKLSPALLAATTVLTTPATASAEPPTLQQAKRAGVRAADRETNTFGIDYRYADWIAECKRMSFAGSRRWVCGVRTNTGQCFGSVHVVGTRERPRARRVDVSCGE